MKWWGYRDCNKEATVAITDIESYGSFGSMCLQHADAFDRDMERQAKANQERYLSPTPDGPSY